MARASGSPSESPPVAERARPGARGRAARCTQRGARRRGESGARPDSSVGSSLTRVSTYGGIAGFMAYETLLYEVKDRIARVTINRPDKRNALNATVIAELIDAFRAADADANAGVIVL